MSLLKNVITCYVVCAAMACAAGGKVVWHWNAEWAGTPNALIVFN